MIQDYSISREFSWIENYKLRILDRWNELFGTFYWFIFSIGKINQQALQNNLLAQRWNNENMVIYACCCGNWTSPYKTRLEHPPLLIQNTSHATDREASQDNKGAREESRAWKEEINWNNCLLQRWICYRYYGYSQQNHFSGITIASLNQSLHLRLMWYHDILDLQRIFARQVRKLWRNSPFASPNMKAW